ncbi:HugZ family protein [Tropicimonas sp. IMCC34043]|uniref:HugZ family pyridoxamine 5'-phosphate oxidase n=1 Tax=Tropicimonas sp. IMCC34043 TaxID=2248760 RepID=UPI000E250C03|nr:pyridoxamine 5'-phosphate oxidase family protein [Tropicimonas sp. IMCC34043]
MTDKPTDPIRPTDAEARTLARRLIAGARFAALGVIEPGSGAPMVTRVAIGTARDGVPLTLISTLAQHTGALTADPAASLLLGEPGPRGDPLSHPRLTLQCVAKFVGPADPTLSELRADWLRDHPKARLYVDFPDFGFVRFAILRGFLNGGFGKAYMLAPADLVGAEVG